MASKKKNTKVKKVSESEKTLDGVVEVTAKTVVKEVEMEEVQFDPKKHLMAQPYNQEIKQKIESVIGMSDVEASKILQSLVDEKVVPAFKVLWPGQLGTFDVMQGRVSLVCSKDKKVEGIEVE